MPRHGWGCTPTQKKTMAKEGQTLNIKYTCTKDFPLVYFEAGFLKAGDVATVTGWWIADAVNPLYEVTRADGEAHGIYREQLLEHGHFH
jgi:hypothetical protein